jgi:hypothetical protein
MTQKVYRLINASLSSGTGSTSKVKITSVDNTENYLNLKIDVQDGLTKEITNPAANEVLTLGLDASQINHTLLSNIGTNSHAEIDSALNLITDVNWTGDYNNGTTYAVGDGVMYNGASFRMIAFIGAAGYAPPAYPGNWLQVTDYVSPNDIGLGNVDNTSDADKPISDDTQDALDLKVAKAGDIMTGNLNILPVVDESESTLSHASALFIQKDAGDIVAEGSYTANGFVVTTYDPLTSDVLSVATLAEGKLELVDGDGDPILPAANADVAVKKYVDDSDATKVAKAGDTITGNIVANVFEDFGGGSTQTDYAKFGPTAVSSNQIGTEFKSTYVEPGYDSEVTTYVSPSGVVVSNKNTDLDAEFSHTPGDPGRPVQSLIVTDSGFKWQNYYNSTTTAVLPTNDVDLTTKQYVDNTITTLSNELKIPQAIYVNNNPTATGYVATGSIQKPYQTIKAALDSISDASAAKRYCIVIAPGTYNELNTIRLKGFVDLISIANDTVVITVAGGSRLLWSNNSPGRVFITDIAISNGVEVLNDDPTGTSGCVLDLDNVDTGTVIFNGRGGGRDFIQLRNDTRLSGSCTINSAATTIFDSTIIGNVNLTDTGCVAPDGFGSAITATLRSNYQLNVNITSVTYDIYVDAWGNNNVSTLTMTSNSAVPSTFNSDAISYPNTITLSGSPSPVVARTTQARAVSVNPTGGIVSTDVQSALEELASEATGIYGILEDTNEPTGFVDRTESVLSFNDSLRKFTIAPVTTNFSFYIQGTKYIKTAAEELVIPNTDGNHYIYYDANGDLTSTTVFSSSIIEQFAFVAIIYWNSEINEHVYFAEERHGITMDGVSHSYLHTIFGARYLSGLALEGFTVDGAGTNDADAQFTSDSGSIRDEDILHILPAQSQIPVYYRQGQLWRRKAPNGFPFIYSGTVGYTGAEGRIPYNEYTGGAWQLTEVANNAFVLIHYFATNDIDDYVIAIQGTNTYGNVTAARLAAATEISSLAGLPFAEFVAIGSVVLESSNSYSNTPQAIVRSINGGDYIDFRGTQLYTPAGEATTHGLLSGLANDDHPQYHTDSRANTWLATKTTDDLTQGTNNLYLDIPDLATPSALDAANDDLVIYSSIDSLHRKIKLNELTSVVGSAGDITETSASFLNNISTPTNVVGLAFATAVVSSFEAQVVVSRGTKKEVFTLLGVQIDGDFSMSVESVGVDTGIDFTISDLGQVKYTSTDAIDGGTIKFRAITLTV